MPEFKLEAIAVLVILLPGFLAARIKQRLTVNREQSELDKIVEALLYSFVTYLIFALTTSTFPVALQVDMIGNTSRYSIETHIYQLIWLAVIALGLAIADSFAANNDYFGQLFRWMRVSRRSWRDSIWSDVFHNFGQAVQVELADGRSVMGWLKYFSDRPEEASLFLERAAWIDSDLNVIQIDGPGIFLTKESGIRSIAFLNWKPK
jgi:hypothetical protein